MFTLAERTSAVKLSDNLLNISWELANCDAAKEQVTVTNLPDVFESCKLTYYYTSPVIYLELDFMLSKSFARTKCNDPLIIFASKDGIKQKMTLKPRKWTASWKTQARTDVLPYHTKKHFDIGIHFTSIFSSSVTIVAKHVFNHTSNLWKTKTLADVTFRCKDEEIRAHTFIVVSCSSVLAAMFANDFKENREKIVDIKDITYATCSRLLQFMYMGDASLKSDVSDEEITELLISAEKYAVETLKEDCALHLSNNLKVENASRFLVLAHIHNSSVLLESTLEFMSKNAEAVCSRNDWMDIIKNHPELCFQAMQLMVRPTKLMVSPTYSCTTCSNLLSCSTCSNLLY